MPIVVGVTETVIKDLKRPEEFKPEEESRPFRLQHC